MMHKCHSQRRRYVFNCSYQSPRYTSVCTDYVEGNPYMQHATVVKATNTFNSACIETCYITGVKMEIKYRVSHSLPNPAFLCH